MEIAITLLWDSHNHHAQLSDTINKGKGSVKRVKDPTGLRNFPIDHQVDIVRIVR